MKKAFTIIETLVAITILMIAISGPLTSSFRALTASSAARDQMTANFLAQEAIELVRNVKDKNVLGRVNEGPLDGLSACTINSMCSIDTKTGSIVSQCSGFQDANCRLHRDVNTNQYINTVTSKPTNFYRTFYLKQEETTFNSAKVVVDVVWPSGAYGMSSTTIENELYFIVR